MEKSTEEVKQKLMFLCFPENCKPHVFPLAQKSMSYLEREAVISSAEGRQEMSSWYVS